jgi:TolB protein
MSVTGALLALLLSSPAWSQQDLGPFTTTTDIGELSRKTIVTYDRSSGIYFISAAGENIWGERDSFGFVSREIKGDASIGARIRFMGKSQQPHRKAGVMFRQSLSPDSVYADVVVHGNGLTSLQYRAETGGPTREIQCLQEAPTAVRLEKRGDYLQVFAANEDGVFLSTGCTIKIPFHGVFHAGLGVCAHDNQAFENARFSSVTVGLPPPRKSVHISALEIVPVDSLERRVIWYSSTPMEVPSFTAKGDAVCFREDGQLKRLSLIGRAEPGLVDMTNIGECEMAQPLISAAQKVIHKVDGGRAQIWLEPADGRPRRLTSHGNNWLPRLAPDAQSFVFLSSQVKADKGKPGTGDYLLMLMPLAEGDERVLAQFYGGPGSLGISPWSPDGKRVVFVSREPRLPAD